MFSTYKIVLSVPKVYKIVFAIDFLGQVMSSHHSDQMSERSQVSSLETLGLLFNVKNKKGVWLSESVSQWVTRSPIELSVDS